jgi:Ran GTPase-activating protein (RanGAP) involved in mRNA processing and transport
MLKYFPDHKCFKTFYNYINSMKAHITCLRVSLLDKTKFKSNNYYLQALIGRMDKVKNFKFHKDLMNNNHGLDSFKSMEKGFTYFQKSGGALEQLNFSDVVNSNVDEYFYTYFKTQPSLRVLRFSHNAFSEKNAQVLGKVLSDFKHIQELEINDCRLNVRMGREIADGLMRAKQLELLKVTNEGAIGAGIDAIFYNLAFSPKIRHIDVTNTKCSSATAAEAVYKMMKISGSLETLILKHTQAGAHLGEDFYVSLGENKTLTYLNLDFAKGASYLSAANAFLLGKSCAMNHKKGGALRYLSAYNSMGAVGTLNNFVRGFKVSDYDHEMWYGDKKTAKEMVKEQLEARYEFALEILNIESGALGNLNFNLKEAQKVLKPEYPQLLHLVAQRSLHTLNLAQTFSMKLPDMLQCVLGSNPAGPSNLRVLNLARNKIHKDCVKGFAGALKDNKTLHTLDLSCCKLGVSGIRAIAEAMKANASIKSLNLYRNNGDVDGARCLGEMLKVNSTIEYLDVGYNRLRQKGAEAILDGILANPGSQVRHLGIRFNFISDDGIAYIFDKAILAGRTRITHLYMMHNYLKEHMCLSLHKQLEEKGVKNVYVDMFDKIPWLNESITKNSIWMGPVDSASFTHPERVVHFFQKRMKSGIVKHIRVMQGQNHSQRSKQNTFAFVQFRDEQSVNRALRVASTKKSVLNGVKFRIFRAGTRTVVFMKSPKPNQHTQRWSRA